MGSEGKDDIIASKIQDADDKLAEDICPHEVRREYKTDR